MTKVQSAVSSQSWQASIAQSSVSPTLAAFAAALADHMHPMWAELVSIEEGLGLAQPNSVPARHASSLLKLECELPVGHRTHSRTRHCSQCCVELLLTQHAIEALDVALQTCL